MSQAEALLNSLAETVPQHKHQVPDSDTYFLIDPYTRQIENTNYQKTVLMQGDHNSERFTFELPRYVDGHDMSLCNRVIVHFDNVGEDIYNVNSDVAYTDDLRINPNDTETVICSWLIRREATQIVGILSFSLQYQCVEDEEITYEWNTDSYDDIEIRKSKNNGEGAIINYSNVLEEWRTLIFGAADSVMANISNEGANQVAAVQNESATQQAAIELKGSETLATIPDDYTEVYNMASEAVRTKGDAIICEAKGKMIDLDDSSDDYIRGLSLYGKSSQFTTTGKNKVNLSDFEFNDSNYTHMLYPTSESATALYEFLRANTGSNVMLSMTTTGTASGIDIGSLRYYGGDNVLLCAIVPGVMHTIKELPETFSCAYIYGSTSGASAKNLQIEFGEVITEFEPYTGGIPAPNPEYQQAVNSVDNPTVTIHGTNLLKGKDGYKTTVNGLTCEYEGDGVYHIYGTYSGTNPSYQIVDAMLNIPVDPNSKYTISAELLNGTPPDDFHPYVGLSSDTVSHRNWMAVSLDSATKIGEIKSTTRYPTESLTNPTTINKFWIYAHNDNMETYTTDFRFRVWLTKSDAPMPYETYTEQKIKMEHTFHGIPVNADGNYTDSNGQQWICDEIDLERGVYVQRIGEKVLSGAETYSDYIAKDGIASVPLTHKPLSPALCTHGSQGTEFNWANDHYVLFRVSHFNAATIDEFKAYIIEQYNAGTPIIVQYILAAPIEIPLTAEEITTYKSLRTNYPNTTVLNDAGTMMKLKYNADTKLYAEKDKQKTVADIMDKLRVGVTPAKIGSVTLLASAWEGQNNLYSQVVDIDGVTENSQVDLTPGVDQLAIFYDKDLSFVTENDRGVVTIYAIGQKPTHDYTIQVTITEVEL